ncbi:MAG: phosphoribosyltransferase family protein [Candidatus Roizmanbacteria bacterium]|nr:phosphoribosyltransferase family protein [Candidatus Roizmanbacteria bacterium]
MAMAHKLEAPTFKQSLPVYGVVDGMFYSYDSFIEGFQCAFKPNKNLYVENTQFKNGEAWVKVVVGDKGWESDLAEMPRGRAIIPFWISTQFGEEAHVKRTVARVINALTRSERDRPPLVDQAIGVSPYTELRQDKDGSGGGPDDREVGEALEAELIARDLIGLDKFLILGAHSFEGLQKIKEKVPDVLPVTATPLFAEHIQNELFQKKIIDPKNTRIVALDKGSLQQCIMLSEQLDLPPDEHIISFDKNRKGHNMVGDLMLQYGDPKDMVGKDMIIYDDIIDTFGSMKETCKALRNIYKCKSITIIGTHGVLSHPARGNAINSLDENGNHQPIVDRIIMSDSLVRAKYAFKEIDRVSIIPVESMLGNMTQFFAEMTAEQMMGNEMTRDYILDPQDKELVWEDFKERYAIKDRIHLPIDQK